MPNSVSSQQHPTKEDVPVRLGGQCLVLEDNMVIAPGATDMLAIFGASHVHTASSVVDGFNILSKHDIGLALLDLNIGDETPLGVIEKCLKQGIRAILASGYGANSDIVEKFPNVPVLSKSGSRTD